MVPKGWRVCLALLLAACAAALPGCFGGSSNPSYFPYLLPTGDIIQTHAKPVGPGYSANFDKYAADLIVRPLDQTNSVRTQYVVVATVRDEKGKPLRDRRIEWMLEGVGHIVEVDEDGCAPGRGYKVSDKYAVSYTDYFEHTFTRGTQDPNDDFTIRPGQSWCVITSPIEGDTHLTVYAPGIFNWDTGRVFVSCKWVNANWIFPPNGIVPASAPQVLTTSLVRHTDKQPLANYRVRYTILDDDPPTVFAYTRSKEQIAVSDLSGNASVTLLPISPKAGLTRVAVEVIRPPDPTSPSGVAVSLAKGETAIEWLAPSVRVNTVGPQVAAVGAELIYNTSISNSGKLDCKSMTVTQPIPPGVQYIRSQPPAVLDNQQLVWTLGKLPPGQSFSLQSVFRAVQGGAVTCSSTVATEEGVRDSKSVKTDVGEARLRLNISGPPVGQVNVPFSYQINVVNDGPTPMTNVSVEATFDKALQHSDRASTMALDLGTLKPQESRNLPLLTLTPLALGRFGTHVNAKADGGLFDAADQSIAVQQAQLSVKLIGPPRKYLGWPADWEIRVTNDGDAPLTGIQVKNVLPPELAAQSWTDGGKSGKGEVLWDVGDLRPGEQRTLGVKTRCEKLVRGAVNRVIATARPGLTASDQVIVDVLNAPGPKMEAVGKDDPDRVGKTAK